MTNQGLTQKVWFEQISNRQGLSQVTVRSMYKDDQGFMWFGTTDGLNRYDGHDVKRFDRFPADSNHFVPGFIGHLSGDSCGRLWIATGRGGLYYLDQETDEFIQWPVRFMGDDGKKHNVTFVAGVHTDEKGQVWAWTSHGLYILRQDRGGVIQTDSVPVPFIPAPNQSFPARIDYMLLDGKDRLWLSTPAGLLMRDQAETGTFREVDTLFRRSKNQVAALVEDQGGGIWIFTVRNGFYKYEEEKKEFIHFPDTLFPALDDDITAASKGANGELWIGLRSNGLVQFFPEKGVFEHLPIFQANTNKAGTGRVQCLFFDDQDLLWIGTDDDGVYLMKQNHNKFTLYNQFYDRNNNLLTRMHVFSVFEDSKAQLWLGTAGFGVVRMAPDRKDYHWPDRCTEDGRCLTNTFIRAFQEDHTGHIWIGTHAGLFRMNPETEQLQYFAGPARGGEPGTGPAGRVIRALARDPWGNIWVGSFGGLDRINPETLEFDHFAEEGQLHGLKYFQNFSTIFFDLDSTLWAGTFNGLVKTPMTATTRPETCQWKHYGPQHHDDYYLPTNFVSHINQASDGTLWVTSNLGFFSLAPDSIKFKTWQDARDMPNNFIYCAYEDNKGNLWMATNRGISKFNPKTGKFLNFVEQEGLQDLEFNNGAHFMTSKGEIFMGGIRALNGFYPDSIGYSDYIPPIYLTHLTLDNSPDQTTFEIRADQDFTLRHNQNFFTFRFTALDYMDPMKNEYAYKLEGLDKSWNKVGNLRQATYTNVPPGKYTFRVKASNNDGIWSENEASIKLEITPPIWQTAGFYLLVLLTLISIVVLVHRTRVRQKVRRVIEIEDMKKLENERIRQMAARDFHDEMGHRLTRILMLSGSLKTRLKGQPGQSVEVLDAIRTNCEQLAQGTRDFIWSIDPRNDSLLDLAFRLKDFGDDLFEYTDIHFKVTGIDQAFKTKQMSMTWQRQLVLIFKEGMNNALKHAKCTQVELRFNLKGNLLKIELLDDGQGMSGTGESNGYGLASMKSRAEKLIGDLKIDSQPGQGTAICFSSQLEAVKI